MASYTSGSGGSIAGVSYSNPQGAASLERAVYGRLALLEEEENNLTKVAERTDRVSITVKLSTKTASIDLLLNVVAANVAGGATTYTATHYLIGSTFTSGTGGDSSAPNLAQAHGRCDSSQVARTRPREKTQPRQKRNYSLHSHTGGKWWQ